MVHQQTKREHENFSRMIATKIIWLNPVWSVLVLFGTLMRRLISTDLKSIK